MYNFGYSYRQMLKWGMGSVSAFHFVKHNYVFKLF